LPLVVSVNLSAKQFATPNLLEKIESILAETQIDPCHLKLEITESAIVENTEAAAKLLKQLKRKNIQLSIDDFGTGYSSLSYLHHFPLDTLKIDGSFIKLLSIESDKLEIVRAIINLAHNLGMDVVAEGVETQNQIALLKVLECEFGQGYFFAKPLDAAAATALIPEWPKINAHGQN